MTFLVVCVTFVVQSCAKLCKFCHSSHMASMAFSIFANFAIGKGGLAYVNIG